MTGQSKRPITTHFIPHAVGILPFIAPGLFSFFWSFFPVKPAGYQPIIRKKRKKNSACALDRVMLSERGVFKISTLISHLGRNLIILRMPHSLCITFHVHHTIFISSLHVWEYPECHGVLEISTPEVEPRGIHFGNIVFQGGYLT
jgi:hypothetical protein